LFVLSNQYRRLSPPAPSSSGSARPSGSPDGGTMRMDVHAEIGEQLRRVRGGPVGEIEDPNAGERTPQRGEMISHRP